MVSFSLGKKNGVAAKKTGFGGFSLGRKGAPQPKPPSNPFVSKADEDDDENKTVKIDTFDSQSGAFNKEEGPILPKEPLVIKNEGNSNWRQVTKERFKPRVGEKKEHEAQKLDYGINFVDKASEKEGGRETLPLRKPDSTFFKNDLESRPDVATFEEYEEVPVEDFGAAMLRGMGWKGDGDKDNTMERKEIQPAKRTQYLGLGAKDTTDGKPVAERIYNPVKRIDKRTGRVVEENNDSRSRDRSPARGQPQSYRTRG